MDLSVEPASNKENTFFKDRVQPTTIFDTLESSWTSALKQLGKDPALAKEIFQEILDRHSGPERAYHNLVHLHAMLKFLDKYTVELENPALVVMAVFFHDAVYNSKAKDNEEQSAELARNRLAKLSFSEEEIEIVAALVLSTKKHFPETTGMDNKLFLDADLSILGQSPKTYYSYSDAIREEYSWVPEADYSKGRVGVLKTFLNRERIYYSDVAHKELNDQARINLASEIQLLENGK